MISRTNIILAGVGLMALAAVLGAAPSRAASPEEKGTPVRLLYWNIQNGMWDGQGDNYDRFVNWVAEQKPDICVWCEGQSIWKTDSDQAMDSADRYLPQGWTELAGRYGHSYVYIGGYRDDYPQVITSRFPVRNIDRLVGAAPDSIVTHGAGWAAIDIEGRTLNIVTLHTWPQRWAYEAKDREKSKAECGGDAYRRMEMEYICSHTVLTHSDAANEYWLMLGDHNAKSRVDNYKYGFPADTSAFLVHDYIRSSTPYVDIIAERHPGEFRKTMHSESRIDFIYATPALYKIIDAADVVYDEYTEPVRDPQKLSNFWRPSDHRPIMVDFNWGAPSDDSALWHHLVRKEAYSLPF